MCGIDTEDCGTDLPDSLVLDAISRTEGFYLNLKPIEGSVDLFNSLRSDYGYEVEILTTGPEKNYLTIARDKKEWVRRHLGDDVTVHAVPEGEKPSYAKDREHVLIDGSVDDLRKWYANGGTPIQSIPNVAFGPTWTTNDLRALEIINDDGGNKKQRLTETTFMDLVVLLSKYGCSEIDTDSEFGRSFEHVTAQLKEYCQENDMDLKKGCSLIEEYCLLNLNIRRIFDMSKFLSWILTDEKERKFMNSITGDTSFYFNSLSISKDRFNFGNICSKPTPVNCMPKALVFKEIYACYESNTYIMEKLRNMGRIDEKIMDSWIKLGKKIVLLKSMT